MLLIELNDSKSENRVLLRIPDKKTEDPVEITLDCPRTFTVTRHFECIYVEIAEFTEEVSELKEDWQGMTSFASLNDDLVIKCTLCQRGVASLEFCLDSSGDDPDWSVALRIEIPQTDLAQAAASTYDWLRTQ